MSRPWMGYLAGAAFALSAATAVAAYAQGAPAPDAGARDRAVREADGDAAKGLDRQAMRHEDREVRREEHRIIIRDGDRHFEMMRDGQHMDMTEHLRTMLQLKPGQEAALAAYVAALKPQHREHDHMVEMSRAEGPKTTTERLADMEKRMAENQAAAHARIEATRRFYAQLEPSQKKVFDEMPMLMIGPMGPIGPMMLPGPMKIRFEHPPVPPVPPVPPAPPGPPRAPPPPRL
ncbi:MAG: Spy/CpxP family protein refolding chaperone [Phenylobacterium sp.]